MDNEGLDWVELSEVEGIGDAPSPLVEDRIPSVGLVEVEICGDDVV